jgi:predicted nucleotidyltransferase component of viral defense system
VFGWLISGLFQATDLNQSLVLKGGNALRKGYFPRTRFSDDLDFSSASSVDGDHLLAQLNEACKFVGGRTGITFELDRNRIVDVQQIDRERQAYKVRLYFKDFAGLGPEISLKVRVDVTEFDRLYLPVQLRNLIHQYSDASACATEIRVVKLEEALADKLKCLLQRRYCFDLFDAVYAIFIANDLDVDKVRL